MPSLKELSKKEEKLSKGHRLCPGCGASIIVRQILLAAEDPVVLSCATGCLEVATTIYPYTAWKTPFIHCAFENSSATLSGAESAYRSLKKQGKIDKAIKFIAFGGDGGTYDIGLQALSGILERGHNLLYVCYDNQAYMNCLSTSSLIMTKNGLKKITEINEGDEIYAFDQKTHRLVLKKCSGVFNNGIKDVYEVTTLHHSIKATANHPFLVLKRNGRGKENNLVWKTISEMKTGDEVVVLKNLGEGKSFKFDFDKVKKGDYKVNRYRYKNFLIDNNYFEMEKVTDIKLVGPEPTLDLRIEGEHNFIADGIVVHNTGIQRSSASPCGAATTTSPVGKVIMEGKQEERKDLTEIVVAHGTPYVAQASPAFYNDLMKKVQKALSTEGPSFMNILSPCPRGWRHLDSESIEIARLAVLTGVWPLYEVENGQYRITYRPRKKRRPLIDWIKSQGRFKHLLREENKVVVERLEKSVRQREERLLALAGEKGEAL
jgi:pyruvate ferredoxin oxidoreductase beta subunit